jgi:hypothetical protein
MLNAPGGAPIALQEAIIVNDIRDNHCGFGTLCPLLREQYRFKTLTSNDSLLANLSSRFLPYVQPDESLSKYAAVTSFRRAFFCFQNCPIVFVASSSQALSASSAISSTALKNLTALGFGLPNGRSLPALTRMASSSGVKLSSFATCAASSRAINYGTDRPDHATARAGDSKRV